MRIDARWQVQEAKQRFSELIRAAQTEGVQYVTRHGQDVAVVIDIETFHQITETQSDLKQWLRHGPKVDDEVSDEFAQIMDQVVAERKLTHAREIDLSDLV